ncbi:MAG: hypothetical protein AAFZ02_08990 [Pseudomonadota bacterium]
MVVDVIVDPVVRLEANVFSVLTDTQSFDPISLEDQTAILETAEKGVLFAGLLKVLHALGVVAASPEVGDIVTFPAPSFDKFEEYQAIVLANYRVTRLGRNTYAIHAFDALDLELRVSLTAEEFVRGSLGKRARVVIDVMSNNQTIAPVLLPS